MTAFVRSTIVGCVCIVVFDAVASVISRAGHLRYESFSLGSFALYFVAGILISRGGKSTPLQSLAVGALIGMCEATAGWWLSGFLGASKPPSAVPHHLWPAIALLVALWAAAVCAFGYIVEHYLFRRVWPQH